MHGLFPYVSSALRCQPDRELVRKRKFQVWRLEYSLQSALALAVRVSDMPEFPMLGEFISGIAFYGAILFCFLIGFLCGRRYKVPAIIVMSVAILCVTLILAFSFDWTIIRVLFILFTLVAIAQFSYLLGVFTTVIFSDIRRQTNIRCLKRTLPTLA
jgi:hypothetical protein